VEALTRDTLGAMKPQGPSRRCCVDSQLRTKHHHDLLSLTIVCIWLCSMNHSLTMSLY